MKLYTEMGTKNVLPKYVRGFLPQLVCSSNFWQIVSVARKRAFNSTNDDQVFLQVVLKVVRASEGELQIKAQTYLM